MNSGQGGALTRILCMADELQKTVIEETVIEGFRYLSNVERSAILMDGRLRAMVEGAIAAKGPPQDVDEARKVG